MIHKIGVLALGIITAPHLACGGGTAEIDEPPATNAEKTAALQAEIVHMAETMMDYLNMLAFFASPKIRARAPRLPTQEEVLKVMDAYLAIAPRMMAGSDGKRIAGTLPATQKLRDLFANWEPSKSVPVEIQDAARALLAALDVPEPSGGWDAFEGPPQEEPGTSIPR